MLNERTYSNILARLENYEDVETLSARQLANITYTSPSTISRFVKKSGFRNFNEMKLKLIQEKESNPSTSNVLEEWGAMFNVAFSGITTSDLNIIEENKKKKILVYSERMYILIARQFVESLSLLGTYSVMVTDLYLACMHADEDYCLISIGELPKELYYRNINYYEVKFKSNSEEEDVTNINRITFTTPHSLNFNTTAQSFQIACMNVYLCMIVDRLSTE